MLLLYDNMMYHLHKIQIPAFSNLYGKFQKYSPGFCCVGEWTMVLQCFSSMVLAYWWEVQSHTELSHILQMFSIPSFYIADYSDTPQSL